jgi:hypothetical protein
MRPLAHLAGGFFFGEPDAADSLSGKDSDDFSTPRVLPWVALRRPQLAQTAQAALLRRPLGSKVLSGLHKIRSCLCEAAAFISIQSTYKNAFFIDSSHRRSKTIIVL